MPAVTAVSRRHRVPGAKISQRFLQWLTLRDQVATLDDRVGALRDELREVCLSQGVEDETGSFILDLPDAVPFSDHEGRKKIYRFLKCERRLTPSVPTPNPEKAVELLKAKGLWLTPTQERQVQKLAASNSFIHINIEIDRDQLARAIFDDTITEQEYEDILDPQRETFAFVPKEK